LLAAHKVTGEKIINHYIRSNRLGAKVVVKARCEPEIRARTWR
jgi:hypothetical protein